MGSLVTHAQDLVCNLDRQLAGAEIMLQLGTGMAYFRSAAKRLWLFIYWSGLLYEKHMTHYWNCTSARFGEPRCIMA